MTGELDCVVGDEQRRGVDEHEVGHVANRRDQISGVLEQRSRVLDRRPATGRAGRRELMSSGPGRQRSAHRRCREDVDEARVARPVEVLVDAGPAEVGRDHQHRPADLGQHGGEVGDRRGLPLAGDREVTTMTRRPSSSRRSGAHNAT